MMTDERRHWISGRWKRGLRREKEMNFVKLTVIVAWVILGRVDGFSPLSFTSSTSRRQLLQRGRCEGSIPFRLWSTSTRDDEYDVVVIGSGVGGLSCAALSSKYGLSTLCVEAHDTAGGVAHSFTRYSSASKTTPFCFDSGPSLMTGLSSKGTNPLRQVLDAIGTADDIDWVTYDGWLIHDLADSKTFKMTAGSGGEFERALEEKAGRQSREAFEAFKEKMLEKRGLSEASGYIPPFALRGGARAVFSLAKYTFKLMSIGSKSAMLTGPFSHVMDEYGMNDSFIRKWFDYLAFALSGEDATHTQAAAVLYMMSDLHRPGAVLEYPMGGVESLIQALVTGLQNHGGKLQLNSRVERLLLEEKDGAAHCSGVVLDNGRVVKAKKGVVCNAPLWNMARILEDSIDDNDSEEPSAVRKAVQVTRKAADKMEMTRSFMHLHLGIPSAGLGELESHHSVLNLDMDVTAEQNMVIISIPTVLDPRLAPDGYHVVHAYTAACDRYDEWEQFQQETGKVGCSPNSSTASTYNRDSQYQRLKDDKAQVLWRAIEQVIPDIHERVKRKGSVVLVGTPLTHRRYNQRFRGTYGPCSPSDGCKDVWELGGATTKVKGLLACGDTTFPGIGLPGVAASGTIAANTLVSLAAQMNLMKELKENGALQ